MLNRCDFGDAFVFPGLLLPAMQQLIFGAPQEAHKVTSSERNVLRKRLSTLEQACDAKAKDIEKLSVCLLTVG